MTSRTPWIANLALAAWCLADALVVLRYALLGGEARAELGFALGYIVQIYFLLRRGPARATLLSSTHIGVVLGSLPLPYLFLLVPGLNGGPIQSGAIAIGGLLYLWAAISLGSNFSLFASRRTLVTRGPYAFVRHPIYLSYLIADAGIVATNPRWETIAIYLACLVCLIVRSQQEERVLQTDPAFAAYAGRARHGLPFALIGRKRRRETLA